MHQEQSPGLSFCPNDFGGCGFQVVSGVAADLFQNFLAGRTLHYFLQFHEDEPGHDIPVKAARALIRRCKASGTFRI